MKTLKFGQIDWTGLKSVLMHTFIAALLAGAGVFIGVLKNYDYGMYTPLVAALFVFASAFIKKLSETYSVVVPNTPVTPNSDTGTITPDTTLNQ